MGNDKGSTGNVKENELINDKTKYKYSPMEVAPIQSDKNLHLVAKYPDFLYVNRRL